MSIFSDSAPKFREMLAGDRVTKLTKFRHRTAKPLITTPNHLAQIRQTMNQNRPIS
jgi:hypothetical protein